MRSFMHREPAAARQGGWVGLIVILLALVIVALLAKDALKQYGLVPGAASSTESRDARRACARAGGRRRRGARSRRRSADPGDRRSTGRAASRTRSSDRPTSARRASTARSSDVDRSSRCAAMNNDYPHPIIAREGWPFLAIALAVALALSATGLWLAARARVGRPRSSSCSSSAIRRATFPASPNAVLSPADGRSSASKRRATRISSAMRSRSASS